jgi:hypothetical protein
MPDLPGFADLMDARIAAKRAASAEMLSALKFALKTILDEAEARNYEPPANCELVAELEYAIAKAEGRS